MSFPPLEDQVSPERAAIGVTVAAQLERLPGIVRVEREAVDMFTLHNFLDPGTCATLIELIDSGCQPSPIFEAEGYGADYRNSSTCNLNPWDPRVRLVDLAIAGLLGIDPR
ncbi:MAG: hypothetical protein ABIR63_02400, partial [Sphingomicrobium sp.]